MYKQLTTLLLLFVVSILAACGDSDSNAGLQIPQNQTQPSSQQATASNAANEQFALFNTAIAYAQRVTEILKQVTDDASAEQAIQEIDALAQQRAAFNEANLIPAFIGTREELDQLSLAKQQLDEATIALEEQIGRIVFSGEGGTAIPKTGPMREVTRAVRVRKSERRR